MNRQAIINLSTRFIEPGPHESHLNAAALRQQFRQSALRMIGAYDDVTLLVDSRHAVLSARPVLAGRLMARRSFALEDLAGTREPVSWTATVGIVAKMLADTARWKLARRGIESDVAALSTTAPQRASVRAEGHPLYLRPDLWFGLRAGGSIGHVAGIVNAMQRRGLAPLFVTTDPVPSVDADVSTVLVRPKPRWLPVSEWQHLLFNRELLRAFESAPTLRTANPAFIYQRHALHSYAGIMLARRYGVPLVLEYNGSETWVANNWGAPLAEPALAERIERAALTHADLIVIVSKVQEDEVRAHGVPAERILVNPNAVDLDAYRPDIAGAPVRQKLGLGEAVVIGFIGTFGPWHGVEVLVNAFSKLRQELGEAQPRVKLLLIGDGTMMPQIRALVDAKGINDAVRFTGLVPQNQGPAHLAAADILVSPQLQNADGSEFFGSPTKLFEYMAMGRPVVASAVGQMRDVIDDDANGILVPANDANALANALARLVRDAGLRHRLGAAARLAAETHHSHGKRLDDLMAALNRVSERPRRT
jgi:glycosyltransferase involved in cell wall biosynthesis